MKRVADSILDKTLTREIVLKRLAAGSVERSTRILLKLRDELVKEIVAIDPSGTERLLYQRARADKLIKSAQDVIQGSFKQAAKAHKEDLAGVASAEQAWTISTTQAIVGVDILTGKLSESQLRALASDTLIQGAPSRDWWARQAEGLRRSFSDTIRTGMMQGKTNQELVQLVRGTSAFGFTDGLMSTTTRNAEALVRTSVQQVANSARGLLLEENPDVVEGVQWVSTLDGRTTLQCIGYAGHQWTLPDFKPVGHDKEWPGYPPIHWNCRSTTIPVLKSFNKLTKSRSIPTGNGGRSDLQTLFEKKLREQGMSEDKIAQAVFGARASMDGQVARDLSFGDWLSGKSEAFQDKLLGPGRATLWRDGKITLSDLINQNGRPLTLAQLKG